MATVTHLGTATWTTTAGNKTVTATPAVGDLIVIVCANSGRITAFPPTVTDNNSSGAYVQTTFPSNTGNTKNSSADSMWIFVRTTLVTAASSTIFTSAQSSDTGGGLDVFSISGMVRTGTSAVRQQGGQDNQASGTPAVILPSAVLTANPCIGAVFTTTNGTANSAPPTGWTEATDLGYATPASGIETCFRSSGETNTTITFGAAAPSAFCSAVVEFEPNPVPIPIDKSIYRQIIPQ